MAREGKHPVSWLMSNLQKGNLVESIDKQVAQKIANRVVAGYNIDCNSRADWRKTTEEGLKVAKQITEKKSFPWQGAANIKYPLIATAAIQFAARAYPQIITGQDVVKATIVGEDPTGGKEARAKRISQHMSWQVLEQMPEWEPDMDQLFHGLPIMGTYFKKTFFDPLIERNRSIALTPFEVVVNLKHKGDLTTCRRISHEIMLYKNEVLEREMSDMFIGGSSEKMVQQNDEEESIQELFIEQHMWYDLDGDGYDEPYIATVFYDNPSLCRLVPNYDANTVKLKGDKLKKIEKIEYFTKFLFIPDPEGDFYGIGFARLLGPINEAMSTLINQLLDAGSLSNCGGGFISKGLRWQGGRLTFDLGEWKPVDTTGSSLKDSILPMPVKEPSAVLFQLLGLLDTAGQKLASVSDAMSGEMPSQNTPATTTLAMIEQGLKVFTAIYKRVFRSLKAEYLKLYILNGKYMEETEYFKVLDSQHAIKRVDYGLTDMDVAPVADPTMSSEAQRLARANALMQTMQVNPDPMGKAEILLQYYDAIGAKNIDKLLNMETIQKMINAPPPPDPAVLKVQLDTQKASDDYDIKLKDQELRENEAIARIQNIEADTNLKVAQGMKALADAEAVEPGQQLLQYRAYMDDLKGQQQHERELKKIGIEQEEEKEKAEKSAEGAPSGNEPNTPPADGGMAPSPNDTIGPISPAGSPVGTPGPNPVGADLESELAGSNGDANYNAIGADLRAQSNAGTDAL